MRLRFIGSRLFASDTGGAGGTATPPPTGSDPGTSNAGGGDPGKVPASSSGDDPTKTDKTFTQADLDRIVKERLADSARRAEAKTAEAKKAAEEQALADNAEWKTLADQRAAELETTKAQAAAAAAYAKRLNAMADAEIAAWPDEVKGTDPGGTNVEARLDWLEKMRPLAQRLASLPKAPATEAGAGSGTLPALTPGEGKAGEGGKGKTYRFTNPNDVSW
jgi:hypothetical protein